MRSIKEFVLGLIEYARKAGMPVRYEGNKIWIGHVYVKLEADLEEANELMIFDEETIWEEDDGLHYYNAETGEWWYPLGGKDAQVLYERILRNVNNVYVYKRSHGNINISPEGVFDIWGAKHRMGSERRHSSQIILFFDLRISLNEYV